MNRFVRAAMRYHVGRLRALSYTDYLQTRHWQWTRRRALAFYHHRCQECGYLYSLEVHHLHYDSVGCEKMRDLRVLCRKCHQREYEGRVN